MLPNVPLSTAIASGAVLGVLLDTLVDKGILQREDVKALLGKAQAAVATSGDQDSVGAARIISGWFQKFSDG